MRAKFKKYLPEVILASIALAFSFWLMLHTFSWQDGSILIASKAWSDFASHIPLIRSFSLGDNWPPEYPIFPGEPIRYHFLFYWGVGILEKLGLRIDYALNIPSALSFFLLLLSIYLLARHLFKSRFVASLSVLLFLFNGSFSCLEFFRAHPLSINTLSDLLNNTTFPSFGPYDGKTVSAFWNLNVYTNQRHLALPFSLLLLLVYFLLKDDEDKKVSRTQIISGGLFIGILPFAHSSIFAMAILVLGMLFILLKRRRLTIVGIFFLGFVLSLPRVIFLGRTAGFTPILQLGYLTPDPVNFISFSKYWFLNLGLSFLLIPVGFLLSSREQRRLLVAFLPLFLVGNLVQFTIEMAGNHKFFNVFLAVSNIYVAYVVFCVWKSKLLGKVVASFLIIFLTLSGVIDFFAIKNDSSYKIEDYSKNPDVLWIRDNTPKNAVFLNSTYLYNPASLAGRKIFLGWPYFAWSLGHDTNKRDFEQGALLLAKNPEATCGQFTKNNIEYVVVSQENNLEVNSKFLQNSLKNVYNNPRSGLLIFSTEGCIKHVR